LRPDNKFFWIIKFPPTFIYLLASFRISRYAEGCYQGRRVRVSVSVVHCVSVPETAQHPARISGDHAAAGERMRIGEALRFLIRRYRRAVGMASPRFSPSADTIPLPEPSFSSTPFSTARLLSTPSSLLLPPSPEHPITVVDPPATSSVVLTSSL